MRCDGSGIRPGHQVVQGRDATGGDQPHSGVTIVRVPTAGMTLHYFNSWKEREPPSVCRHPPPPPPPAASEAPSALGAGLRDGPRRRAAAAAGGHGDARPRDAVRPDRGGPGPLARRVHAAAVVMGNGAAHRDAAVAAVRAARARRVPARGALPARSAVRAGAPRSRTCSARRCSRSSINTASRRSSRS